MLGHRLGVARRLAVLVGGAGILAEHGAHVMVLGVVEEMSELLVDDGELLAQLPETGAGLAELAFDRPVTHCRECTSERYRGVMGIQRRVSEPVSITNTSGQPEIVLEIDGLTISMAPPAKAEPQPAAEPEQDDR